MEAYRSLPNMSEEDDSFFLVHSSPYFIDVGETCIVDAQGKAIMFTGKNVFWCCIVWGFEYIPVHDGTIVEIVNVDSVESPLVTVRVLDCPAFPELQNLIGTIQKSFLRRSLENEAKEDDIPFGAYASTDVSDAISDEEPNDLEEGIGRKLANNVVGLNTTALKKALSSEPFDKLSSRKKSPQLSSRLASDEANQKLFRLKGGRETFDILDGPSSSRQPKKLSPRPLERQESGDSLGVLEIRSVEDASPDSTSPTVDDDAAGLQPLPHHRQSSAPDLSFDSTTVASPRGKSSGRPHSTLPRFGTSQHLSHDKPHAIGQHPHHSRLGRHQYSLTGRALPAPLQCPLLLLAGTVQLHHLHELMPLFHASRVNYTDFYPVLSQPVSRTLKGDLVRQLAAMVTSHRFAKLRFLRSLKESLIDIQQNSHGVITFSFDFKGKKTLEVSTPSNDKWVIEGGLADDPYKVDPRNVISPISTEQRTFTVKDRIRLRVNSEGILSLEPGDITFKFKPLVYFNADIRTVHNFRKVETDSRKKPYLKLGPDKKPLIVDNHYVAHEYDDWMVITVMKIETWIGLPSLSHTFND